MKALLVSLMLLSLVLPVRYAAAAAPTAPALPAVAATPAVAAGTVVTEEELRQVVRDFLTHKTEHLSAQVVVKKIGINGDLKLPAGKPSFEVVAPNRWEGYGSGSLALIVRVDDQVKKNLTVQVEVEALAEMVVTTRTLERGEVVTAADVAVDRRDLAHVQGRYSRTLDEVLGLRVKSAIRANAPLRGDFLERVPVVKSGQLVTIVAENDVVRITASGRAKGAGAVGDTVSVQNLSSQKEIAARVVDATTVKVDF
jgi:flagellar basal body P-ring formation protein FlgA